MLALTSSSNSPASSQKDHQFGKYSKTDHRQRVVRRRCIHCYQKLRAAGLSAKEAKDKTRKVNTVCLTCRPQPSVCLQCYLEIHVVLDET